MRRWFLRAALLSFACTMTGFDCGSSDSGGDALGARTWAHPQGKIVVDVATSPFALTIRDASGKVLLESSPAHDQGAADDPVRASAPLAVTHNEDTSVPVPMKGWNYYRGQDDPWKHSTKVAAFETQGDALIAHVETSAGVRVDVKLEPQDAGLHLVASLVEDPTVPVSTINRVSLGFKMHDDDHFFGFGERFVRSDHRGQSLYTWVEDGGFGHGEDTPPGIANPSPSGEGETNMPIPWFMSPRGFGMLLNGSTRTVHHLGDESPDAWRVESWRTLLDATIFADADPLALVASLTSITGRPPEVADWVLAPRRRADPGSDETLKLRAAHIPTSVADADTHYFPNGGGTDSAAMKAVTADLHARGFKAVAYFCPFIADSWHPVFEEAAGKGYLVKHADGTTYTVLDPPYNAGMIDFTNPDAVRWYQAWMQRAIDDGWDGWMYDFAEYVPMDAAMFDGTTGMEAHNKYPVLYQQAAFDLFEKANKKTGDYLIFVRSGFTGTGGKVPMVWAGDQSTDFDLADGLPAALTGALNAGMSGIPLWGSDIGGYHFVFNPPPDKEVYLRWTEVGAFSADMHDENSGAGSDGTSAADRWSIWKDQESQDVYRKYASIKTRMIPYVKLAVRQARERGTPVMRHLYLSRPTDPNVWGMTDEYMYGDALLVAPVVSRGKTSRSVYLPDAAYFDFWSGARVKGGGAIDVPTPLDTVPVFARIGAIVPMLHPQVETVVPFAASNGIAASDHADWLEVMVFAGGESSITLDDGTVLSQKAPADAFTPSGPTHGGAAIPMASTKAELDTCDACAWDDAASHVWTVAVKTQDDSLVAGPLTVSVKSSPSVKRYVFTVRH